MGVVDRDAVLMQPRRDTRAERLQRDLNLTAEVIGTCLEGTPLWARSRGTLIGLDLLHCCQLGQFSRELNLGPEVAQILDKVEVVAALCHDIGKLFSIPNHGAIAGEMLKPYVADDIYHAIVHHQDFQGRYYYEHLGKDPNAREKYRGEPWFDMAEKIVDRWDAPAFDPDYDVDSLESFEPEIRRVFAAPKRGI